MIYENLENLAKEGKLIIHKYKTCRYVRNQYIYWNTKNMDDPKFYEIKEIKKIWVQKYYYSCRSVNMESHKGYKITSGDYKNLLKAGAKEEFTRVSSVPDDLGFAVDRIWAMPNKWTFTIKPIANLLKKYCVGKNGCWADPFCGENSPANITNDINKAIRATYNTDALEFLKNLEDNYFTGILYDPPYSITQARMYGKKEFASMKYWADCKNAIARAIKPGGYAICFGWNSNGLGKNRGFRLKELLLIPHGGSKNDTIITVEEKIENNFYPPQTRSLVSR